MKLLEQPTLRLTLALAVLATGFFSLRGAAQPAPRVEPDASGAAEPHRSPIALALSSDGSRLLTANQTSGSVSLVDTTARKVLHELKTGDRPAAVAISKDGKHAVVAHWWGYDVAILDVTSDRVAVAGRVEVGPEPRGVAIAPDGKSAYVSVGVTNEVVKLDLASKTISARLKVGREPRAVAITPDGSRLLVANSRNQTLSVVDLGSFQVEKTLPTQGDNLRQIYIEPTGKHAYLANMFNRGFATTRGNIDIGWVVGQRVTRVAIDGSQEFETLTLDVKGLAAADVHGVGLSNDGKHIAVSSGGTHEVFLFRTDGPGLPWRSNGSRDIMEPRLTNDKKRFRRIEIGGRPTELVFSTDGKTVFVANYLSDAVQAIDVATGQVTDTIALGAPKELSLVRKGEALFHDATRSFNQWYSCNTCHSDGGHTNGLDFDTMNDGWHDYSQNHLRSRKKVPTLRRTAFTKPWTWHGWQKSLEDATNESFTKSMQGKAASDDEVQAVMAYLTSLDFPRNPNRKADGELTDQAKRGEKVFRSAKAACSTCHSGPEFTDGKIHEVGLEASDDYYKGFNPPSLRGVYDKDPYLHDGRGKTLKDVLSGPHNPENLGGESLSPTELDDLIAYIKSL